jgi:hypothetical protein
MRTTGSLPRQREVPRCHLRAEDLSIHMLVSPKLQPMTPWLSLSKGAFAEQGLLCPKFVTGEIRQKELGHILDQ